MSDRKPLDDGAGLWAILMTLNNAQFGALCEYLARKLERHDGIGSGDEAAAFLRSLKEVN